MHPSPLHVLIVDDSPEDRVALRRFLSQVAPAGYTVREADRGEQALAICRAAPPDCVLLDYRLPDRDGLAVLAALRTFTDVPVVLLTGVGHEALAVEAFQRGAQDYLAKGGWTPEQLHLSIQRAVATVQVTRERDHALARLDALVTSAPSGIGYLDRELRYVLINPSLAAINGQPPEAHLGRTLAEMLPGLAPQLEPLVRQVLATGEAVREVELRGRPCPHDGAGHDWLLSFYPVRGPTGGSDGVGVTVVDITEARRAEQALRASQQNLASLIENTDGSIWSVDTQYRLIVGNRRFHHDVGAPLGRAILAGESLIALPLPQEPLDAWRAWYDRALGGATFSVEVSTRFAPEPRTMEYRFSPIRTAEGSITGVTVVGQDITAQQRAEATIARLAERLELATRAAHIGVWDWDIAQNQLIWDERMYALYGVQPNDIAGAYEAWLQGVHPDDRAASDLISAQARRGERPYDTAFRVVWPDGRARVLKADGEVFWDAEGRPQRMIGVNYDITERTQAEAELRRAVARLETLHTIDQAVLGAQSPAEMAALVIRHLHQLLPGDWAAVLIDAPGRGGCQLLAASDEPPNPAARDALIAISTWYRDHGGPTPQPWQVAEEVIPAELVRHAAVLRPPGSGALLVIPLQAQGTLIGTLVLRRVAHDPFGDDHLAIAGELADQIAIGLQGALLRGQLAQERDQLARRVEERTADLSLANAELARAARLKDEFLASMSHELRTPLNAILGRAEVLQEGIYGPVTPQQIAALQGVEESGRHLLTLINDILDLSKIEAGRLELASELVDVDLLCTLSMRMVAQGALAKRLSLAYDHDSQVQRLHVDERRLKQILVNLLANAVKFTPEGGKVGLEVRGNPEQQTITFTVWDTGIGIAAEDLPRLFQPFVQIDSSLSRQYTGTGLGLSLVARLTKAHGGSVAVESAPGQGSRFHVTLPWSPADRASRSTPTTAVVETQRPAIQQVLVIEDSPVAAAQITRYLRELGAKVEVLPHGTGTIERAIALQPDVIILDILLPDDDGWEVLRRLKAEPRTQAFPVLVISVVDQPEQAGQLGAAALLVKPIDRAVLEQALRRVLLRAEDPPVQTALVITPAPPRPTILFAEDNETNIATTSDYLRAKGYDVRVARNGHEAVARAQEERPDVILMDIQMPGMDGLEAMRRIRAEAGLRHVPIIALTALAMPGDRERCLEAGATAYLAKPVNLRSLEAMIRAHLQPEGA